MTKKFSIFSMHSEIQAGIKPVWVVYLPNKILPRWNTICVYWFYWETRNTSFETFSSRNFKSDL